MIKRIETEVIEEDYGFKVHMEPDNCPKRQTLCAVVNTSSGEKLVCDNLVEVKGSTVLCGYGEGVST